MMDTHIDQRIKRTWHFFAANASGLLLGGLVVLVGSIVLIPGPWFALNLLQETLESARAGRPVRWQATYERPGNFLKSWALVFVMGIPILIGYALLIVPGVILSLFWFHAPMLVADGRKPLDALSESHRIFQRRKDWAAYLLNWLVPMLLSALTRLTALALLVTLPLTLAYLIHCYTDEVDQAPLPLPPRDQVTA